MVRPVGSKDIQNKTIERQSRSILVPRGIVRAHMLVTLHETVMRFWKNIREANTDRVRNDQYTERKLKLKGEHLPDAIEASFKMQNKC